MFVNWTRASKTLTATCAFIGLAVLLGTTNVMAMPSHVSPEAFANFDVCSETDDLHQAKWGLFKFGGGGYRGLSFGLSLGTKLRPSARLAPSLSARRFLPRGPRDFSANLAKPRGSMQRPFRNALGISNPDLRAHHIVPVDLNKHPIVVRAARGGFNIHGTHNGVPLHMDIHRGRHPQYSATVKQTLDGIWAATKNKKIKDWQYAQVLLNLNRIERKRLLQENLMLK